MSSSSRPIRASSDDTMFKSPGVKSASSKYSTNSIRSHLEESNKISDSTTSESGEYIRSKEWRSNKNQRGRLDDNHHRRVNSDSQQSIESTENCMTAFGGLYDMAQSARQFLFSRITSDRSLYTHNHDRDFNRENCRKNSGREKTVSLSPAESSVMSSLGGDRTTDDDDIDDDDSDDESVTIVSPTSSRIHPTGRKKGDVTPENPVHVLGMSHGTSNQLFENSVKSDLTDSFKVGGVGSNASIVSSTYEDVSESRIIAPHVSKLAPLSTVELRLHGNSDCVAILCSVDVLKMRSVYFHDILEEQERNKCNYINVVTPWRSPINIRDASPFEAAAFLESLHEGRALFQEEWSLSWCRLSVTWAVEELANAYAKQIESTFQRIFSTIQKNSWRTNPNVLSGMKVAIFRKGAAPTPVTITGVVIESASTGYSKCRIAFDNDKPFPANMNSKSLASNSPASSPFSHASRDFYPGFNSVLSPKGGADFHHSLYETASMSPPSSVTRDSKGVVGDIGEPFWVQAKEGGPWCDPDEIYIAEAKKFLTITDKRIFWEMVRVVMELPDLGKYCNTMIRSKQDLSTFLRKAENRVLFTENSAKCLPQEVAVDLINEVYIIQSPF